MPWTKADEQAFSVLVMAMGEVFSDPVSPERFELYAKALEDLPYEAVAAAATTHIRTGRWFPKPAEIRELIEGAMEDRAELAWSWLLREVHRIGGWGAPAWPDAATQHATEGLFGGWRALCERLPAEGPELLGYRKQFIAGFGASARQSAAGILGPGRAQAQEELAEMKAQLKKRGLPTGSL
jgi:hypothetical protein